MNIIIVGAGEVGRHLAESLSTQLHNISVIELSEKVADAINEHLDVRILVGSGSSSTMLAEANVGECELFLALTSDDNTNLVAASLAKAMGAQQTIARVHTSVQRDEWLFDYRGHFGIDYLFSAERLAAVELAKFVRNPERLVVEELARGRIELQQIQVAPESKAAGKMIRELGLPQRVRIASIQRDGNVIIPTADDSLYAGDLAMVFGDPMRLSEAVAELQPQAPAEEEINVVIFGGGDYGFALAQMIEAGRYRVRIMEKDAKLCRELSKILQRTIIINGDATSLAQLRQEQVGDADFFIATSRDDEDNVMACLQARNLGVKYCLTLIHRGDYADVISRNSDRLGMLAAVSPRVATSRDLLRFVTSDKFHIMMQLPGGAEVLEFFVRQPSMIAGKKISEVQWPPGSGLMALIRGQQAIVPAAADEIHPGDTLYAIVSPDSKKPLVKLVAPR